MFVVLRLCFTPVYSSILPRASKKEKSQCISCKYSAEDTTSELSLGLLYSYDLGTDCSNCNLFLVGTCSGVGPEEFAC